MKILTQLKKGLALSSSKGFTLIELLVVIAIIGILVALVTANFLTAQKQARDAKRQQHMEGVQTSFETYYVINNAYPTNDTEIDAAFEGNARPEDPQPSQSYVWNSDANSYCVCAELEAKEGNADDPGSSTTCSWNSTGTHFCIQNKQ